MNEKKDLLALEVKQIKKTSVWIYLVLHLNFLIFSSVSILAKFAASYDLLSLETGLFYGAALVALFIYAIIWQKLLKRLPLITAFANKAITIFWGMIFGKIFFGEAIKFNMLIGFFVIFAGIYLVVKYQDG